MKMKHLQLSMAMLFSVFCFNAFAEGPIIPPQEVDLRFAMATCIKMVSCKEVNKPINGCLEAVKKEYVTDKPIIELSLVTKCTLDFLNLTCEQLDKFTKQDKSAYPKSCVEMGSKMAALRKK